MQISLNLHNLCKNTKIFLKNIILLKMNVLLDKNSACSVNAFKNRLDKHWEKIAYDFE